MNFTGISNSKMEEESPLNEGDDYSLYSHSFPFETTWSSDMFSPSPNSAFEAPQFLPYPPFPGIHQAGQANSNASVLQPFVGMPEQPFGLNSYEPNTHMDYTAHTQPAFSSFSTPSSYPLNVNPGAAVASPQAAPSPPKRPGRKGKLKEANRKSTAENRRIHACLYHSSRKTKCLMTNRSAGKIVCDRCENTKRPCYRVNPRQLKSDLSKHASENNSEIMSPFLKNAEISSSCLPLTFEMNILSLTDVVQEFKIELQRQPSRHNKQRDSITGDLDSSKLQDLGSALAFAAQAKCCARLSGDDAQTLRQAVWKCLSWHMILQALPKAEYCSSEHPDDIHRLRSFVASVIGEAVDALREALKEAVSIAVDTIMGEKRTFADPVHESITTALAALCHIAKDQERQQIANKEGSILLSAASAALPLASDFLREFQELCLAFHAIKDPAPDPHQFELMIKDAIPRQLDVGLRVIFDSSKSESSETIKGMSSNKQSIEAPVWTPPFYDTIVDSQSLMTKPVASLFGPLPCQNNDMFNFQRGAKHPAVQYGSSLSGEWNSLPHHQNISQSNNADASFETQVGIPAPHAGIKRESSPSLIPSARSEAFQKR